jgi:predicted RNase H-like nuclease
VCPPVLGIDGCPAGWFWWQHARGGDACGIAPRLRELLPRIRDSRLALIDIPIGLTGEGPGERPCDVEARRLLGRPRASSVFRPPCRAALEARDYREACDINRRRTGKGISRQAWNIVPKIREVDAVVRLDTEAARHLREAHPELVIWALNGGVPMRHNKKLQEGFAERCRLLGEISRGGLSDLHRALARYPRHRLARDDAVDALALALGAVRVLEQGAADDPGQPALDPLGVPMEMVFPAPDK